MGTTLTTSYQQVLLGQRGLVMLSEECGGRLREAILPLGTGEAARGVL